MKVTPIPTVNGVQQRPSVSSGDAQVDRMTPPSIKLQTNRTPTPREYEIQETIQELNASAEKPNAKIDIDSTNSGNEEKLPISPQYAALARQKRALQVKEKELLAREQALSSSPNTSDLLSRLKTSPLSVLQENGVTYEQLTEAILAEGSNPELAALKAEIKALKEGVDKRFDDTTTAQEQQVYAEMKREAQMLVKGEQFELVRETNSVSDVMSLIERTYRETGEVLDVAEAMTEVENYLMEETLKIARSKKIQSRLTPESTLQQSQQRSMKTLTSRDTASKILDRKARALAAFYNKK